ncbi:MAG: fumarylacetoacetate hydrolase family protein [Candidatus Bathyarchaeota archaeon]|nr:fumarylacetoacetate hydrolase family protein [Candidatus Bathyarchaeota archaeon]
MKLVVFGPRRLGALLEDGSVVDLNLARAAFLAKKGVARPYAHASTEVPSNLLSFIEEGEAGLKAAEEAISFVGKGKKEGPKGEKLLFKPGEVKIHAPLPSLASRIAMAGANFYDHSAGAYSMMSGKTITEEELRREVEEGKRPPWGFWKHPRNVVGPDEPIVYPARSERLDYEVEVAAVFGKKAKDVPEEEAMDYVYGYTIVNDLSLRDQPRDNGLFLAKNFDTSTPMGPCIVTADEVGDPHRLRLRLKIDGEVRQDATQEGMIRGYPFWISFLTRDMTFYPGDMICGGTCAGTAMDTTPRGPDRKTDPVRFLKPGQVVEACVEKIGTIRNRVTAKE